MGGWKHFSCHVNDVSQDASVATGLPVFGVIFIYVVVWGVFLPWYSMIRLRRNVYLGT
jgi:hypothetical protein